MRRNETLIIICLILLSIVVVAFLKEQEANTDVGVVSESPIESTPHKSPLDSLSIDKMVVEYGGVGEAFAVISDTHDLLRTVEYDGTSFTDVSVGLLSNLKPSVIGSNGEYWLIGTTEGGLIKYDGTNFVDLTQNFSVGWNVKAIAWNEQYWLIGSEHKLVKYDGKRFTDLSRDSQIPPKENSNRSFTIHSIGWNGEYWLIGTYYNLLRYDGVFFIDITNKSGTGYEAGMRRNSNLDLAWNGDYWLIGGGSHVDRGRILKYDGVKFTDLTENLYESVGHSHGVEKISWNGEYWLVGVYGSSSHLGSTPVVIKYDGNTFSDLTTESKLLPYNNTWWHMSIDMAWNGDYWLLGSTDGKLVKYDGIRFIDVSDGADFNYIKSIEWGGEHWLITGRTNKQKYYPNTDEISTVYRECDRVIAENSDSLAEFANMHIPDYENLSGERLYTGNANLTGDVFKNMSQKYSSGFSMRKGDQSMVYEKAKVGYSIPSKLPLGELRYLVAGRLLSVNCIYNLQDREVSRIQFSTHIYFAR